MNSFYHTFLMLIGYLTILSLLLIDFKLFELEAALEGITPWPRGRSVSITKNIENKITGIRF